PKTAERDIQMDKTSGLVDDETYQGYPSSYYIQKAGYAGLKTLSLTFDDGPDPTYTPKILDVLKEFKVPGTFFVIGQNAGAYPDLVRRTFEEGHEIGSHTFTHPNLDETTDKRTEYELNATQRIIQGITGRTTALFRPPYNADSEPTKPEDVRPIILASHLGYITVGESLDPQDWRLTENMDGTGARRTPDEIVQAVLYQISKPDHGNTILLHDGGGDRTTTVAALRKLIPLLQSKGYRFVPVSALLGTSRDTVMPPLSDKDRVLVGLDKFAFGAMFTFEWFLRLAFLTAIGLGLARVLLNVPLAIVHERRKFVADPGYKPSVSVLIAAYNEEAVIGRTISSILASEYPVAEVIVVDDGSKDATFLEVVTQFAGESRVVALKQENGGKASALNRALSQARGEILVCIDADTQLMPEAIGYLVRRFKDRKIGAVAGNVKVGNRLNLWTWWQSIEYITSQNLDRRAYATLGAISVCPGAIGAWRKTAVVEAGGYMSDTLAEDMDLTWRLQRAGWTIETESAAFAYTEAPDTFKGFFAQRFRWAYGTLQCLWKHRRAMGRHGWFGWLTLPSLWLFQILFQVLAPLVDVQLVYTTILATLAWVSSSAYTKDWRPAADVMQTLQAVAFLYGLFFTVELVSGFIAYRMDREKTGTLWWLFFQRLVYRQIMYVVIYKSIVTAIRGRRQGWGKLERKATVELEKHDRRERATVGSKSRTK
ncbi:MAG TPA: glycosyltransferase, partial [Fimbriimonadaceae bacterium]|nr:glycosyltransferase [Fimbriimonadaceae bacterium]